eukprot:gene17047-18764_t
MQNVCVRCGTCNHLVQYLLVDQPPALPCEESHEIMQEKDLKSVFVRPCVSKALAICLASEIFDIVVASQDASVVELDSYEDKNFRLEVQIPNARSDDACISSSRQSRYVVLKIMNAKATYLQCGLPDAVDAAMEQLKSLSEEENGIECPVALPAKNGGPMKTLVSISTPTSSISDDVLSLLESNVVKSFDSAADSNDDDGIRFGLDDRGERVVILKHYVRLLTYVPGVTLASVPITEQLLFEVGALVARVVAKLEAFSHPALQSTYSIWNIQNLMVLKQEPEYLDAIKNRELRERVEAFLVRYEEVALPILSQLSMQTIHSDISRTNILVKKIADNSSNSTGYKISGLLDFGDLCFSYRIFELASCMAHAGMERKSTRITDCGFILAGYLSRAGSNLSNDEYNAIFFLLAGRLMQIVVLGYHQQYVLNSANEYTMAMTRHGHEYFEELTNFVGRETELVDIWKKQVSSLTCNEV